VCCQAIDCAVGVVQSKPAANEIVGKIFQLEHQDVLGVPKSEDANADLQACNKLYG
jgi:hypothetical protein